MGLAPKRPDCSLTLKMQKRGTLIMFTPDEIRHNIEVLRHGGKDAIALFIEISAILFEGGNEDALRSWITIALPALPELEKADVLTSLMTYLLSSDCAVETPILENHYLH